MLDFISADSLQSVGFVFALLFIILGAVDGIYFHLIRYQLHRHPESRLEHLIHSVRGILLAVMGLILFGVNLHSGEFHLTAMIALIALIVFDLILEIVDIYVEKDSRATIGGVSSSEMVLHVFASSFRMGAIVALIAVAAVRGFSPEVTQMGLVVSAVAFLVGAISCLQKPNVPSLRMEIRH